MDGAVDRFMQRLGRKDVEHTEGAVGFARGLERCLAVLFGEARFVRLRCPIGAPGIPLKRTAEPSTERKKPSHDRVERREELLGEDRTNIPNVGVARSRSELDPPHVVERHVTQKRVHAKIEVAKERRFDTHGHSRGLGALSDAGKLGTVLKAIDLLNAREDLSEWDLQIV